MCLWITIPSPPYLSARLPNKGKGGWRVSGTYLWRRPQYFLKSQLAELREREGLSKLLSILITRWRYSQTC